MKSKNSFAVEFPQLAGEWNTELNNGLLPSDIAAHSNKAYWWTCELGHAYQASADKRAAGQGCPYCSNRRLLVGFNDLKSQYPEVAFEWDFGSNEKLPQDFVYGSAHRAHWKCSECGHRWATAIRDRTKNGTGCPKCALVKRGKEKRRTSLAKSGSLADKRLLSEWDYELNEQRPENYSAGSNEYVYWICSKCGYKWKSKINNRAINGRGCPCCANKAVVSGVNDLATTHPELAAEWHPTKNGKLTPRDVTHGSGKKVWWLCPEGHEYQATILHRSGGTGCPVCISGRQTSFAEQAVFYYVRKVAPDAINRFFAPWLERMELDIFIPSLKIGIEYDGMAWHKERTHEREKRKYRLCQKEGVKLVRLREKALDLSEACDIADSCISIDGNMYEHDKLEATIRQLIFTLDPRIDYLTRLRFCQGPEVCISRDESDIRAYATKIASGSLAEVRPDLAAEWHPTRNGTLTPDKVKKSSDIKVWWKCPKCGHEYKASVGHRFRGTACPLCGIEKGYEKRRKAVLMLNLQTGEVLRRFSSISEAAREMKISSSGNISAVCSGNGRKQAGGYGWRYEDVPTEGPADSNTGKNF